MSISTDPAPDDQHPFARANVFGLFLALGFCLIVQPYGSLLYTRPRNLVGKVLFFFWRLNPLACALEAMLIVIIFVDGIYSALEQRRKALAQGRRSPRLWAHLKVTASAAQLMRDHGQPPQHREIRRVTTEERVSQRVVNLVMTGSEDTSTSTHLSGGAGALPDRTPHGSNFDVTDHTTTCAILTRGVSNSDNNERNEPQTSAFDEFAVYPIGARSRSYAQLIVDAASTLAVLLVVTKLVAVNIPLHIRIPAWCLVAGWAAVQALQVSAPRRGADLVESIDLIQRSLELDSRLQGWPVQVMLSVLVLPALGYAASALVLPSDVSMARIHDACHACHYYYLLNLPWPVIFLIEIHGRSQPLSEYSHMILSLLRGSIVGVFVSAVPGYFISFDFWHRVKPYVVWMCSLWLGLFVPGAPFTPVGGLIQTSCLFYNLFVTGILFGGAIIIYDDTATHKPEWLEWLGR